MPKNKVNNLITDQEVAFARHILSGTMTDRDAAQAAGLSPDTAAYTKAKPRVRAYMLEHRTAAEQDLASQQAPLLLEQKLVREKVLARLWEIAAMGPEKTRNSMTSQVKALAMIMSLHSLVPDRRSASAKKEAVLPPPPPDFYKSVWLRQAREQASGPEPGSASAPAPDPEPSQKTGQPESQTQPLTSSPNPRETGSWVPDSAGFDPAPDTRLPFWRKNNHSRRR